MTKNVEKCEDQKMRKQYIIEVDESEIVECWNEQTVKELGYQEYSLNQCPGIKVKPYNPTGDLISREALIEVFRKDIMGGLNWKRIIGDAPTVVPFEPDYVGAERVQARQRGYEEGYHFGMEMGKTLNPKIKQGEWKFYEESPDDDGMAYYKCSECGRLIHAEGSSLLKNYPYCHCGADMRKGGAE